MCGKNNSNSKYINKANELILVCMLFSRHFIDLTKSEIPALFPSKL